MIIAQPILEIYNSEAVERGIFGRFFNGDKFRPEGYSDVMSGVVIDPTGVKGRLKFGDSMSNCSRDIRLPHFVTMFSKGLE